MSTHYDDEAQIEELRRWWKENWLPLAAGLALGLAAIFGWQAYTRSRDGHRIEAAQLFDETEKAAAADQYDEVVKMTDRLVKDFDDTPYAASASLKVAQMAVNANKLDDAVLRLQWVTDHSQDDALKPVAALRLARVLWQQGKPDEALKKLDRGSDKDDAAYAGLFAELRGDIRLAQGDRAAARAAYAQALDQLDPQAAPSREALQRKMDDLADAAVAKS